MELNILEIRKRIIQTINAEVNINLEEYIENHSLFQNLTVNQLKKLEKYSFQTEKIIKEKVSEKDIPVFKDLHNSLNSVSSLLRHFKEVEYKFKNNNIQKIETFKSKSKRFPVNENDLIQLINSYNQENPYYETINFYQNHSFLDKAVLSISDHRLFQEIGVQ
jgi:hypothetical protein